MSTHQGAHTRIDGFILSIEVLLGALVVVLLVAKLSGSSASVFFVLSCVALAFVGYSVFRMLRALREEGVVQEPSFQSKQESLLYERDLLVRGLNELELDRGSGKVDPNHYQALHENLQDRAVAVILEIEEEQAKWTREAELLLANKLGRTVPDSDDDPPPKAAQERTQGVRLNRCVRIPWSLFLEPPSL